VSEERIGKALEDVRDEVYIATKSHARTGEELLKDLDVSLRNLRTDYIDVYQLHNVSTLETWRRIKGPGGALEAMLRASEDGRVGHLGVTCHDPVTSRKLSGKASSILR
jgi:predicted aldo/keto reductase-like oxidoreductase